MNDILQKLMEKFDNKLLLSKKEVASVLGVSLSSVDNYINADENALDSVKLAAGKKSAIRVPIESLANFLTNLRGIWYEHLHKSPSNRYQSK